MIEAPIIKVRLPGPPRGKGRPRFRVVKPKFKPEFVMVYTDQDTQKYEQRLQDAAKEVMHPLGIILDGPMEIFIFAGVEVPASWSGKKRAAALAGEIFPLSKPDGDNIAKMMDALNDVVWEDDSRIVDWHIRKRYVENPFLAVRVEELSTSPLFQNPWGGIWEEILTGKKT